jgi:hypothetical protein
MAATTTMMQQLLQEFAENLGNTFDGIHQQLVNLNTRLQDLEQGRIHGEAVASVQASLDREVAIDDLTTKTKNIMIAAGRSFLNNKLEEPQSSNTTKIITTVMPRFICARKATSQLFIGIDNNTTSTAVAVSAPVRPAPSHAPWLPSHHRPMTNCTTRPPGR